ncbi:MAG: ABC transporter permease [Candidatus Thorarchaeota archaeon]
MKTLRIIFSVVERDILRSIHLKTYVFTTVRPLLFASFIFLMGRLVGPVEINGLSMPYYKYGLIGASITLLFFTSLQAGVYLQYERAIYLEDELRTLPIAWKSLMLARVLSFVTISFISLAVYSVIVAAVIGPELVPCVLAVGTSLSVVLIPLMIVIADRCRDITVYNFIGNILEFLAVFASTVFLPIEVFPELVRPVVMYNPLSMAMSLLLAASFGVLDTEGLVLTVTYMVGLAIVVMILSARVYGRSRNGE